MKPKLRLISNGDYTFIELDGNTLGRGVDHVEVTHDGGGNAKLHLTISVDEFSFMPDGYLDQAAEKWTKSKSAQ